jgi:hypothetical protein
LVPDDLNTEVDHQQVVLNGGAFRHIRALADAGAVTPTAFVLEELITYDRYEALCAYMGQMNRSCSWWIGDLLLYGEGAYGERYAQAANATGLAEQTLMNRAWVCSSIPPERRLPGVPFSVHAAVASRKPSEQKKWLRLAQQNGWTRAQLVHELREDDHQAALERGDTTIERPEVVPPVSVEEAPEIGRLATYVRSLQQLVEEDEEGWYRVPRAEFDKLINRLQVLATRG